MRVWKHLLKFFLRACHSQGFDQVGAGTRQKTRAGRIFLKSETRANEVENAVNLVRYRETAIPSSVLVGDNQLTFNNRLLNIFFIRAVFTYINKCYLKQKYNILTIGVTDK